MPSPIHGITLGSWNIKHKTDGRIAFRTQSLYAPVITQAGCNVVLVQCVLGMVHRRCLIVVSHQIGVIVKVSLCGQITFKDNVWGYADDTAITMQSMHFH